MKKLEKSTKIRLTKYLFTKYLNIKYQPKTWKSLESFAYAEFKNIKSIQQVLANLNATKCLNYSEFREKVQTQIKITNRKQYISKFFSKRKSKELVLKQFEYTVFLYREERERQQKIDSKILNLINQTTLILTLSSLLVPFFFDKFPNNRDLNFLYIFLPLILFIFFIYYSIRSLKLGLSASNSTIYSRPSEDLILEDITLGDFRHNEILLFNSSIKENIKSNNTKIELADKGFKFQSRGITFLLLFMIAYSLNIPFNDKMNNTTTVQIKKTEDEKVISPKNDVKKKTKK